MAQARAVRGQVLAFKWGEVGHRRDWYQGEISEAIPEHISIKWVWDHPLAYEGSSCFAEVPAGITFVWGESVGPPALAEAAERRRNLAAERRCRRKSRAGPHQQPCIASAGEVPPEALADCPGLSARGGADEHGGRPHPAATRSARDPARVEFKRCLN